MKKKIYSALLISVFLLHGIPTIVRADEDSSVEIQAPTEEDQPIEVADPAKDTSTQEDTPEETEAQEEEQSEQTEQSNEEGSTGDETEPNFDEEIEDESDDEETVVEEIVQDTEQEEVEEEKPTPETSLTEFSQIETSSPEEIGVTNHVVIKYLTQTLLDDIVFTTSTYFSDTAGGVYNSTSTTILGVLTNALRLHDITVDIENSWTYYISRIDEYTALGFDGWVYTVDQQDRYDGMNDKELLDGESLQVFYSVWPWKITSDVTTTTVNSPITFSVLEYESTSNEWIPSPFHSISIDGTATSTNEFGTYVYVPTSTTTVHAFVYSGNEAWPQDSPAIDVLISEQSSATTTTPTTGSGSGSTTTQTSLQTTLTDIISFLDAHQNPDGSFLNSPTFSDWVALGYKAWGGSTDGRDTLKSYLLTDVSPIEGDNETTAYARRAMALMSYGISPYSGTATNYIEKIKQTFDGTQFGTVGLINDDIFALIPLLHAGYTPSDPIVASTTRYILSQQRANGSFENPDITGAALQVLSELNSLPNVTEAIEKAKAYLLSIQKDDGGFGNEPQARLYATPWIMQGLSSNGTDIDALTKNGKTPIQYIQDKQGADGSIGASTDTLTNRIWASAYALPALLKKSWGSLLSSFSKPSTEPNTDQSAGNVPEDNIATSTIDMPTPTSTPPTGGSAEENEQDVIEETSHTTELTILPAEETRPVQTITPPVRIQTRPTPQVAGTKIAEEMEETTPTSTQEQVDTPSTTVDTVPEPQNGSEKPLQYAFGLTILLGLILGWKFLRTLV